MKITKSELFNLIKEEIMSEMDGLTMMDDPYDDSQEPESFTDMDQVAEMMENAVLTSMDDLISMISNFLVTTQRHEKPTELMMEGMRMLHQAGFREILLGVPGLCPGGRAFELGFRGLGRVVGRRARRRFD